MQVIEITRRFKYNGMDLPDPNPSLGPDDVRQFYSAQYGELLNAVVEGPTTKAGVATYSFARAAGAKGAGNVRMKTLTATAMPAKTLVQRALAGALTGAASELCEAASAPQMQMPAHIMALVASRSRGVAPMGVPSAAYGLFG